VSLGRGGEEKEKKIRIPSENRDVKFNIRLAATNCKRAAEQLDPRKKTDENKRITIFNIKLK
jgi:hypothetical protein